MSLNNARIAILNFINTNWTATDLVFSGDTTKGNLLLNGVAPWIYCYITWGREIQKSSPAPKAMFMQAGLLSANIYVRNEDGEGSLYGICDSFVDMIRSKQIGDSTMRTTSMGRPQSTESWQILPVNTAINLWYDKTILN